MLRWWARLQTALCNNVQHWTCSMCYRDAICIDVRTSSRMTRARGASVCLDYRSRCK
jgi:hypothetical protein